MVIPKRTGDKVKEHFCTGDAYKLFREENPSSTVKGTEFHKIAEDFNKEVVHKMVYEAFKFVMPGRLSFIRVRKRKVRLWLDKKGRLETKHLKIDYKATKELWAEDEDAAKKKKAVFHLNEHTEGYYARFFWDKYRCVVRNKYVYVFEPCRAAQRMLAAGMKSGKVDFYG